MTASGLDAGPPEVAGIGPSTRTAFIQLLLRTGALRVLTFIGSIILARLLLPSDYGIFAIVLFLVGILLPLADLGLAGALIRKREPPTDVEVASVFTAQQLIGLLLLGLTFLLAPLVPLLGTEVPPDADWMLRVAALAVLVGQLQSVPNAMMARVLRFGPMATIEVSQQLVYLVVAIGLALSGAGAWSFIVGLLAQYTVAAVLTFIAWGRLPGLGVDRAALRGLLGFATVFQLTNLVNMVREALVPVFGGIAGGVTAIGYLHFGQRLGRMVSGIDDVTARMSLPAFSRLQDDPARTARALVYAVESTALALAIIWWPIAVAPTLIPLLFGDTWAPAVPVFQLTAAAALLGPPGQFVRAVGYAAGRERSLLRWAAVAAFASFLVFPLLLAALGLVGGGIGFVVYAAIMLLGPIYATRHDVSFPWVRFARIHLVGLSAAVAAAVTLGYVPGLIGLALSGLVFGATFAVLVLTFERAQLRRAWRMLRTGSVPYGAAEVGG